MPKKVDSSLEEWMLEKVYPCDELQNQHFDQIFHSNPPTNFIFKPTAKNPIQTKKARGPNKMLYHRTNPQPILITIANNRKATKSAKQVQVMNIINAIA